MNKCRKCGGIRICNCNDIPIIDTSSGASCPQEIPNDQD